MSRGKMIAGVGMRGQWAGATLLSAMFVLGSTPAIHGQADASFDAWVSFADKGFQTEEERRAAFASLEDSFNPVALARRKLRRTRPGLFDDLDLPLSPSYLDAVSSTGAELRVRSRWLNGVTVSATRNQLASIDRLPFVKEVTDVHPRSPRRPRIGETPSDPDLRRGPPPGGHGIYGWAEKQNTQLNLQPLHDAGYRGAGVRVAVIDTGFLLDHPALQGPDGTIEVVAQWDFVDHDSLVIPEPRDPVDQHEHGTVVLGALAGNRHGELVGSAPEAEYILLKAEDAESEYFLEEKWFAAALEFAEAHGADLVSSSVVLYEGYDASDVGRQASVMARAWDIAVGNGVIGFQGGGNSGHDSDPSSHHLLPPAGAPGVIAVGAVDSEGKIASFSSDGLLVRGTPKPELLALGRGTASISPYVPGAYTASAGTSMATPVLAGAVACLLQLHPEWTVEKVRSALFESGDYFLKNGSFDPRFILGFGIPDLARAAGLGVPLPDTRGVGR